MLPKHIPTVLKLNIYAFYNSQVIFYFYYWCSFKKPLEPNRYGAMKMGSNVHDGFYVTINEEHQNPTE
jgi:hypothetical protein